MLKTNCRMCNEKKLKIILDLGFAPLADGFLKENQLNEPEKHYPLRLCFCENCGLFQLDYVVDKDELYRKNYPYLSSITSTGRNHFHTMASDICKNFKFSKDCFAVDIGSNIGVLLEGFKNQGLSVLGVDPATNIAQMANERGIETIPDYFNSETVERIVKKYGKADVITATNVFAHIDDLKDLVQAVAVLLKDNGIFVIEVPYLVDLIEKLEYDTIYHEHLSYISVKPLVAFFSRFGMEVIDIQKFTIHGGTIRIFISKRGKYGLKNSVNDFIELEKARGVYSMSRLEKFAQDVREQKEGIIDLLRDIKKGGKRIVGVSASAKGNTLLNYCKIGNDYIDYITEKAETKIGLFTPGSHIKIFSDTAIISDNPDYALLLAWNFADEIMNNLNKFKENGGKFIIPIPKPRVV